MPDLGTFQSQLTVWEEGKNKEMDKGREGGEEGEASCQPIPHRMEHVYILAIALLFPFTQHCFSDTALDSRLVVVTVVTCRSHRIRKRVE